MLRALLLIAATASAGAFKPAAAPVLRLRGGLGGVDTTTAAKALSYLTSANAGYMALAPKEAAGMYGMSDPTPMQEWMLENCGWMMVTQMIISWCSLNGVGYLTATGYSYLPWVILGVQNVLTKRATTVGAPEWTQMFFTALNAFFFYSLTQNAFNAPTVAKVAAGWNALNGLFAYAAPKTFGSNWGLAEMDDMTANIFKFFGACLVSTGVLAGGLAMGKDFTTSLGYTWAVYMLSAIDSNFISKTIDEMGLDKGPQYFWLAIQVAAVAVLLF